MTSSNIFTKNTSATVTIRIGYKLFLNMGSVSHAVKVKHA